MTSYSYKELQMAIKDINNTLRPQPFKSVIGSADSLRLAIAAAIAKAEIEGNPRVANLKQETIKIYEDIKMKQDVQDTTQEVQDTTQEVQDTTQEVQDVQDTTQDDEDCFGVSYDPDNVLCTKECVMVDACKEEWLLRQGTKERPKTKKVNKEAADKTKNGDKSKPGVIKTIINLLMEKPYTKSEIVQELVKLFPERGEKALKGTVNVQVPTRITKNGHTVLRDENNRYFIG